MKSQLARCIVGSVAAVLLVSSLPAVQGQATNLVNDGTTIANLVRVQNQFGVGSPTANLELTAVGGELEASQTSQYSDFPLSGAWYDARYSVGSGGYLVQAEVRPAVAYPEYVLGVMGWLDPAADKGIVFRITPGSAAPFQVATIDFAAETWEGNDSVAELYNLNGSSAVAELGSAWGEGGDYRPEFAATVGLQVTPPTAADLAAVPGATARLTARVHQAGVQVGGTVELLTTLPVAGSRRFGYFASWGTSLHLGEPVGFLDNLRFVGELKSLEPPRLDSPKPLPGVADFREFGFRATGLAGANYRIEGTTNLTVWTSVATGPITGPSMEFTIPRNAAEGSRHYRLVVVP